MSRFDVDQLLALREAERAFEKRTGRGAKKEVQALINKIRSEKLSAPAMPLENLCWGVSDWASLGVHFDKRQLKQAREFPYGEILSAPCPFYPGRTIQETHFVVLYIKVINGQSLTVMKLQDLFPAAGQPRFSVYGADCWYHNHDFALKAAGQFGWRLLLAEIVPNSTEKEYEQQEAMLPAEYEVASIRLEIIKDLFSHKKNGYYPNEGRSARCSDISAGGRLSVDCSAVGGVNVGRWGVDADWYIGVSASRKFPA